MPQIPKDLAEALVAWFDAEQPRPPEHRDDGGISRDDTDGAEVNVLRAVEKHIQALRKAASR